MMKFAALALAGLLVAACEQCDMPVDVNAGVGVGTGGVSGGVAVGRNCGPVHVSVGTGNYYHVPF